MNQDNNEYLQNLKKAFDESGNPLDLFKYVVAATQAHAIKKDEFEEIQEFLLNSDLLTRINVYEFYFSFAMNRLDYDELIYLLKKADKDQFYERTGSKTYLAVKFLLLIEDPHSSKDEIKDFFKEIFDELGSSANKKYLADRYASYLIDIKDYDELDALINRCVFIDNSDLFCNFLILSKELSLDPENLDQDNLDKLLKSDRKGQALRDIIRACMAKNYYSLMKKYIDMLDDDDFFKEAMLFWYYDNSKDNKEAEAYYLSRGDDLDNLWKANMFKIKTNHEEDVKEALEFFDKHINDDDLNEFTLLGFVYQIFGRKDHLRIGQIIAAFRKKNSDPSLSKYLVMQELRASLNFDSIEHLYKMNNDVHQYMDPRIFSIKKKIISHYDDDNVLSCYYQKVDYKEDVDLDNPELSRQHPKEDIIHFKAYYKMLKGEDNSKELDYLEKAFNNYEYSDSVLGLKTYNLMKENKFEEAFNILKKAYKNEYLLDNVAALNYAYLANKLNKNIKEAAEILYRSVDDIRFVVQLDLLIEMNSKIGLAKENPRLKKILKKGLKVCSPYDRDYLKKGKEGIYLPIIY